ncbi:Heat shock protein 78, mitochondrial [Grifola frondosa]|uniref:Heat shock protein 78, mitochondrial n=1 Tax=Grifola frondosa TaxID=5627 RepID=A0A1C7LM16_GRIFR|nr:Heat shock protein 78, mitochondrial [Grifola frondosa]
MTSNLGAEFINRIDEIVIFHTLSCENILKIVDLRIKEVQERIAERKMALDLDDAAKQYLVLIGYSPTYGTWPLNRAIQSELLNPLSVMILSEHIREGETIHVRFDGPHNCLMIIPNHEATVDSMDIDYDPEYIEVEEMD